MKILISDPHHVDLTQLINPPQPACLKTPEGYHALMEVHTKVDEKTGSWLHTLIFEDKARDSNVWVSLPASKGATEGIPSSAVFCKERNEP